MFAAQDVAGEALRPGDYASVRIDTATVLSMRGTYLGRTTVSGMQHQ